MNERKLTKSELANREDIIMKMKKNKRSLVKRYGKDAEKVMYGRATNLAKKQAEAMDQDRIKEMVKSALMGPMKEDQVEEGNAFIVAADAARDAGKKEFEFPEGSGKMHPVTVKADIDEVDATEKAASDKIGRGEEFTDDDAAAVADKMPKISKDKEFKLMEDEDLDEDLDLGHQDNEPHMLKGDLYRIGKYAMELYQMVDEFEGKGEVDFPHWWQSKVIKAKDMLVSAKHYLDFEVNEPQIDAMVDVAAEEEVIDENALGMSDSRLSSDQHRDLDYAVRGDNAYTFGNDPYADDQLRYKYARKMGFLEEDVIDENARDKAAMAFDKMKVGATIKTSKGEFKKVDDKYFEIVGKPGRKFTAKQMTFIKEENLKEGVWALGSVNDIKKAIQTMEMGLDMDDTELEQHLQDNDAYFYNVLGDDDLHDPLSRAYDQAAMGNEDRAHNELSDAIGRAYDLLKMQMEKEQDLARPNTSPFNEIAEKLAKQLKSK